MDILNFISWIASKRRVVTSVPDDALVPVGIRTEPRDDKYTTVGIKKSDLADEITSGLLSIVSVDGVTITGNGTQANPLVATGGGSHYIGELVGGGIVVALWKEGVTEKALIASLTNLSIGVQWTLPAFQSTLIGSTAQSFSNGLTNTNAIIAQTTAPAANTYAAGLARLHSGGGYNDWYLPSNWELNMCYNSAAIVNKVLGTDSFTGNASYWSSTESAGSIAWIFYFDYGSASNDGKDYTGYVRAVRTHTF
jgi:hypothetical protein